MKLNIIDRNNTVKGTIELPEQFKEESRADLVKRAVFALRSSGRQRYGASPEAGKRASTRLSKRRDTYRGSYGHGIARTPRKILTRRGERMNWVGAFAPNTVGGRRAHPPKSTKQWEEKINRKERRKAIRSAISATLNKELVSKRGHVTPLNYPFVIDDGFEAIEKTKDVKQALEKIGLKKELSRCKEKKLRAGKGKLRGRRYKKKTGPMLVVSKLSKLMSSATNIPGLDVAFVNNLNAELLAPGAEVARLTLFTKGAIERMKKERLFTNVKGDKNGTNKGNSKTASN